MKLQNMKATMKRTCHSPIKLSDSGSEADGSHVEDCMDDRLIEKKNFR